MGRQREVKGEASWTLPIETQPREPMSNLGADFPAIHQVLFAVGSLGISKQLSMLSRDPNSSWCHTCYLPFLVPHQPRCCFSPPQPSQRAESTAETGLHWKSQHPPCPHHEVKLAGLLLSATFQGGRIGERERNKAYYKLKCISLSTKIDVRCTCTVSWITTIQNLFTPCKHVLSRGRKTFF